MFKRNINATKNTLDDRGRNEFVEGNASISFVFSDQFSFLNLRNIKTNYVNYYPKEKSKQAFSQFLSDCLSDGNAR